MGHMVSDLGDVNATVEELDVLLTGQSVLQNQPIAGFLTAVVRWPPLQCGERGGA